LADAIGTQAGNVLSVENPVWEEDDIADTQGAVRVDGSRVYEMPFALGAVLQPISESWRNQFSHGFTVPQEA
jgi:hypothetical protein